MWAFVFFDLPVIEKVQRKRYTRFRKLLLREGFLQMQYSVYARYFSTEKKGEPTRALIRGAIPADGHVRLLSVTDRQFSKMENFVGKTRLDDEEPDGQCLLF